MSSLIFLPFLPARGLRLLRPRLQRASSAGLLFLLLWHLPPWGNGPCCKNTGNTTGGFSTPPLTAFEVLVRVSVLSLVGGAEPRAIHALRAGAEALEPHLEGRLAS